MTPARTESRQPQSWDNMTTVETGELRPVAEQASHCRMGILSVGTPPQFRGFEARTQRNAIMFTKRRRGSGGGGEIKSSFLSFSVNISRFSEGQPQYFEELLT